MTDLKWRGIYRKLGPATICISAHNIWIGAGHWLIGVRDHKTLRPLFSERYRKNPTRHYLHLGRWCLHYDSDWMNRRKAKA